MLKFLRTNPDFYPTLIKISLPIFLQGFISTSLTFVDILMVGQLGSASIASVGLGNQFTMIFIMVVNSIGVGAGIFTAQYWGKRHVKQIRKTFGIGIKYALLIGVLFTIVTSVFSKQIIHFYTNDKQVIETGGNYLFLIGMSYIFFSISTTYAAVLRSTRLVMLPLIASVIALSTNTVLNYCLILGHLGFPQLGVTGAGIAMIVARIIECCIIVFAVKYQRIPMLQNIRGLFKEKMQNQKKYFDTVLPVMMQSLGWVLGVTIYMRIYASLGTTALAAVNITETIEKMGLMLFVGVSNACCIMVGNSIGAGDNHLAFDYSKKFLFIAITGGLFLGGLVLLLRDSVIGIYNLTSQEQHTVHMLMMMMALAMWMKASNIIFYGGILRSGGDTRFSMLLDIGGVWLIGAPLGIFAAYYLKLPIYFVVPFIYTEELVKALIGFYRFTSNKWLRNLTHN